MDERDIERIAAWVVARGLKGGDESVLLRQFCEMCCEAGMPIDRGLVIIDTLHPTYEGRAFRWRSDSLLEEPLIRYGSTRDGEAALSWQRSPLYHLFHGDLPELRYRLDPDLDLPFPILETMRGDGITDYYAMIQRFGRAGIIGEMDCVFSQWNTRRAGGFTEEDLEAFRRLVPPLALAIKCASLADIAETLVEVYLGKDAGRRVLDGRITRGVSDRISAVLWFSDLRGYTRITDTAPPEEIIPLLNDYAEAVISAIYEAGGDVLKLIGDGTLAIFRADDPAEACRCAMKAEADLRHRVRDLNARRTREGRPQTGVYLGLHIGEVLYGNIGSESRLDFTVVGPAVNEVSRIASMCRSVDREVLFSAAFAGSTPDPERGRLVSVGRYALRGVGRAQELFTLDPELI